GLVLLLVGFGFITGFSIGIPFLLVGVTLAALSPFRARPRIFWPVLVVVIGFLVGYVLVAPFSCSISEAVDPTTGASTVSPELCRSLLGVEYTGSPQTPGLTIGVLVALVGGTVAWITAGRQAPPDPR
ncbi:MAG: hypothetical protein OER12_11445, partial [Acidimicrobiia bacterium]|nr:hypothetical protein [Acidimicrobiia bacterium]